MDRRIEGKLAKWSDERGYGIIVPRPGGKPVFVHISAFARDGRRPEVGEVLTFEVKPTKDGKLKAVNVQRLGAAAPRPSAAAAGRPRRDGRAVARAVSIAVGVAVLAAGILAYTLYGGDRPAGVAGPATAPGAASSGEFRCDGRTLCNQMASCAEATFFLKHCPGVQLDEDGDGIPCERLYCGVR